MKQVAVVIPIYKKQLTETEKISLKQALDMLHDYPIYFIMPQKLCDIIDVKGVYKEYFPDEFFESIKSYSKLMLDYKFYDRFDNYTYILIYQLDAFVFSDKLKHFCNLGYDYIGAPTPRLLWKKCGRVGNGGLSLRKVQSCIRMTKNKEYIFDISGMKDEFENYEDKFFGYCGKHENLNFTVPSVNVALEFSIENDVSHCHRKISSNNLPFGTHGWSKSYNYTLWEKYIIKFFPDLSRAKLEIFSETSNDFQSYFYNYVKPYILSRFIKYGDVKKIKKIDSLLPCGEKYIIWGTGVVGERSYAVLTKFDRQIVAFFDENTAVEKFNGIKVMYPDLPWGIVNGYKFIIASTKYMKEMQKKLEFYGLREFKGYYVYIKIEDWIFDNYYSK